MRRGIVAIACVIPIVAVAFAAPGCAPASLGQITAARGVLLSVADQPLGSAQIRFFAASQYPKSQIWHKTARALISVSTDSQGAFDFSTITPGTYFLEVRAANVKQTLLATIMPRSKDAAQEIRVRLLGADCNGFEVTTN